MFRETGIVVARIACDFLAEPVGTRERLILCAKLHLGNDEPFIRAMKDIDLPYMAVSCELDMADFLDDAQLTEREGMARASAAGISYSSSARRAASMPPFLPFTVR